MRKIFLVLLAVVLASLDLDTASACGDKLLAMSRSIGLYKAYAPWKIASILIYQVHSNSPLKDKQFQSSLKQAGHKIQVVGDANQLNPMLNNGKYDLLLAEIGDLDSIKQHVASNTSSPSVVPILSKPTKNELATAEKQYGIVIAIPAEFTEHLQAIDRAMKLRSHRT